MKQKRSLILGIVLMLAMVCCLMAGCGNGGSQAELPDFVYLAEYVDMPEGVESFVDPVVKDGYIYFSYFYYDEATNYYAPKLGKIKPDGTGFQDLGSYTVTVPAREGWDSNISMMSLMVNSDNQLCVLENYSYFISTEEDWQNGGNFFQIRTLDDNGAELSCALLDNEKLVADDEYFYINSAKSDAQGNIYLLTDSSVCIVDNTGAVKQKISSDSYFNSLIRLSNGSIAVSLWSNEGQNVMQKIDPATGTLGAEQKLPADAYDVINGNGEYTLYYDNGSNFYGFTEGSETGELLFNWVDSDIVGSYVSNLLPLEDGSMIGIYNDYNTTNPDAQLIILTKHDRSEIPEKTVLTIGMLYGDANLEAEIVKYNRSNKEYRFTIKDYSQYNTDDDYEAGLTKLSTEIISGNAPDLIVVNTELPLEQYAAKGLLEDLIPYMEADAEIDPDDFLLMNALSIDGKLYQTAHSFSVSTCVGSAALLGDQPGWTMDELNAALAANPGTTAFNQVDRNTLLTMLCAADMQNYVDWSSGTCRFDDPAFVSLLEFCAQYPETIDWDNWEDMDTDTELIRRGELLLYTTSLYDFSDYQTYDVLFGGPTVFKGYPCLDGNGNVAGTDGGLAISSTSQHKDVAWDFARIFLTKDYQCQNIWWGYPSMKPALDYKAKEAMATEDYIDEYGNQVYVSDSTYGWDDIEVQIHPMTQDEYDKLLAVITGINKTMNYDTNIFEIISEEAASFFAGSKSAQETADLIQNRVSLYVNEQK